MAERVHARAVAWLSRKGYLVIDASRAEGAQSPLDACVAIATQRGAVRTLGDEAEADATQPSADAPTAPPREDEAAERGGFNLHASVAIAAADDRGRERLCRYGARPALCLDRLRRLPGGRLAYRIKKVRGGRAKVRVMTPLELLARLAALVPPPRYPLVRYHGVLGPRSSWRRDVVPRPRAGASRPGGPRTPHVAATSDRPATQAPQPALRIKRSGLGLPPRGTPRR